MDWNLGVLYSSGQLTCDQVPLPLPHLLRSKGWHTWAGRPGLVPAPPAAPSHLQALTQVRQEGQVQANSLSSLPLMHPPVYTCCRMLLPKQPLLDAAATQPAAPALCAPQSSWGISLPRLRPGPGLAAPEPRPRPRPPPGRGRGVERGAIVRPLGLVVCSSGTQQDATAPGW